MQLHVMKFRAFRHLKLLRDLAFLDEDGVYQVFHRTIVLIQMLKVTDKSLKVEIQDPGYHHLYETDVHLCSPEGGEKEEMNLQEPLPLTHLVDHYTSLGEESLAKRLSLKHRAAPLGLQPAHQYLQCLAVLQLLLPHQIQLTV